MDNYMIGVIVLLVFIFASRAINEKANKKLEQDKKAQLIDLFSKNRVYTFGILIVILADFFLILRYQILDPLFAYIIYTVLIFAYIIGFSYMSYKKLKDNDFPKEYIKICQGNRI